MGKNGGKVNKADILMGVCSQPPNQETNFIWRDRWNILWAARRNLMITLVLVGDLNLPHVSWKYSREEAVWEVRGVCEGHSWWGSQQGLAVELSVVNTAPGLPWVQLLAQASGRGDVAIFVWKHVRYRLTNYLGLRDSSTKWNDCGSIVPHVC